MTATIFVPKDAAIKMNFVAQNSENQNTVNLYDNDNICSKSAAIKMNLLL